MTDTAGASAQYRWSSTAGPGLRPVAEYPESPGLRRHSLRLGAGRLLSGQPGNLLLGRDASDFLLSEP